MATPTSNYEACREKPPCGCPVLNRREHRKWHAYVQGDDAPQRTFIRGLTDADLEADPQ